MSKTQRIIVFHLLNDRSGSPKVLSQLLKSWVCNHEVHLYTSVAKEGFLSNINGVIYHSSGYVFKRNSWQRLFYYITSQIVLFYNMYCKVHKSDIVYVNTVLPFAGALIGLMKGCKVIYHIHESTIRPKVLKWFLLKIVKITASDIINVSKFVMQQHGISSVNNHVVYNAISNEFLKLVQNKQEKKCRKLNNVLMICSLKTYKGVWEFVHLARKKPNLNFCLVLNAEDRDITLFFKNEPLPTNLKVFPSQENVHPFYKWAHVVLNLSKPDEWIETFGMTIIEGMAYQLPSIVPNVGGILEVVENNVTGFYVDSRKMNELIIKLDEILIEDVYSNFSKAASKRLGLFTESEMLNRVERILFN